MKSATPKPSRELGSPAEPLNRAAPGGGGLAGAAPERTHPVRVATPHTPLSVKGLLDVVALVVAAPVLLLIGVPARGYLISAGAWIALRALGLVVDRAALALTPFKAEIVLRLVYMLVRLFALALMAIAVRNNVGRAAGLTALLVIVFAFTVEFVLSFAYRPRRR